MKTIICSFFTIILIYCTSCQPTNTNSGTNTTPSTLTERNFDTAYGTNSMQNMSLYLPAGRNNKTKLIFMIHGGGWLAGDKADMEYYKTLIKTRWPDAAIANINYRLASNGTNIHATEIMNDIVSAVNFVIANKNNFAISDTAAMLGESAGAHLAMLYTYTQNTNNYIKCVGSIYGPTLISDWSWYNSINVIAGVPVSTVLSTYVGATYNTTLYDAVSPYIRVSSNSKPTIMFHGTTDLVVPLYQAQWMENKLTTLGVQHEYYEYPLEGHGFSPTKAYETADKIVSFFQRKMQ